MNKYANGKTCYFHFNEVVVGVCALCLNERLVILASKQQEQLQYRTRSFSQRRTQIHMPKIFALTSLFNRLDINQRKTDDQCFSGVSSSQEDSFISIKFEENGSTSWEKAGTTMPKISLKKNDVSWNQSLKKKEEIEGVRTVVEHVEQGSSLRWRKRIGHLFQLMRLKRSSSKGDVGAKLEGVKVRHGWIRILTKRRTKE